MKTRTRLCENRGETWMDPIVKVIVEHGFVDGGVSRVVSDGVMAWVETWRASGWYRAEP